MSNVTNKRSPPLTQLNSTGIEPESACSKEGSVNVSTVTQDIGSIPIPAESGNRTPFGTSSVALEVFKFDVKEANSIDEADIVDSKDEDEDEDTKDYLSDINWTGKKKHMFILSTSGKPIYSRHGSENGLATLFGIINAIVFSVENLNQKIKCVKAGGHNFVFLSDEYLTLVFVSKTKEPVGVLSLQLEYLYNQIISVLTRSQLERIYSKRKNFDLRRLLAGTEKFIDGLIELMEKDPSFFLKAVRSLYLAPAVRDSTVKALKSHRTESTVFALLLAKGQLVTLLRPKNSILPPTDLHLIQNLILYSDSLKSQNENWIPICLPKFEDKGFLYTHISYLDDDFNVCLLLFSTDRDIDTFSELSASRTHILQQLENTKTLSMIKEALAYEYTIDDVDAPGLKHFLFHSKTTEQWTSPKFEDKVKECKNTNFIEKYQYLFEKHHSNGRDFKLYFIRTSTECLLAWNATTFVLYGIFSPFVTKGEAVVAMNSIVRWIKKNDSCMFLQTPQIF